MKLNFYFLEANKSCENLERLIQPSTFFGRSTFSIQ